LGPWSTYMSFFGNSIMQSRKKWLNQLKNFFNKHFKEYYLASFCWWIPSSCENHCNLLCTICPGKKQRCGARQTANKFAPREGGPGPTASKLHPGIGLARAHPRPVNLHPRVGVQGPISSLNFALHNFLHCTTTTFANLLGMFSEYMCTVCFYTFAALSFATFFLFVLFLLLPEKKETPVLELFNNLLGARNRLGIGLSYRPARLHGLAELIPWNRFLGSLKVHKHEIILNFFYLNKILICSS
jgi:hypothetical protein